MEQGKQMTTTSKEHFETLDGLRGTAALIIVLYHVFGMVNGFATPVNPFFHGVLPVDFFFALSGFVVSYAYDDRWEKMSLRDFFTRRLIRLHPTLVIGIIFGALCYAFDPFKMGAQNTQITSILIIVFGAFFMFPNNPLPNRWTDLYSLNGPQWTLTLEYIANILYALVLRKLSTKVLMGLAFIAGIATYWMGTSLDSMDRGWGWDNVGYGFIRLAYPFLIGMLLYRLRDKVKLPQLGFLPLSAILIISMCAPIMPKINGLPLNGIYEATLIVILFPLIVAMGAHSSSKGFVKSLCNYSGKISYPLYITHFPFLYAFLNLATIVKAPTNVLIIAGIGFTILVIVVAVIVEKFWDGPIRRALTNKFVIRNS